MEEPPGISTLAIAHDISSSQSILRLTFQAKKLHPYHLQRVQSFQNEDCLLSLEFLHWYLDQYNQSSAFPPSILFSDEAIFCREGMLNQHNMHE